jgi:LPS O-antigen subunit length determinant protein (WzzB/FepE family)
MNHSSDPSTEASSIDLLDVLLTLAESAWLILAGAVLAGCLAFGATFLAPIRYESVAVISPPPDLPLRGEDAAFKPFADTIPKIPTLLASPMVLAEALERTRIDASQLPGDPVTLSPARADGSLELRVVSRTPEQAQQLASAILDAAHQRSKVVEERRKHVDAEFRSLRDQLTALRLTHQKLQTFMKEAISPAELGSLANAEALNIGHTRSLQLQFDVSQNQLEILTIGVARLEALSERSLSQRPSLATHTTGPSRAIAALVAAIGGGFVVAVFALMRRSYRSVVVSPSNQARWKALTARYLRKR